MNIGGVSLIRRRDTSLILIGGKNRVGMEATKFVIGGSKCHFLELLKATVYFYCFNFF